MSLSQFARKTVVWWCLAVATSGVVLGQANYLTNGGEYAIAGTLPGDQVFPDASLSPGGGYLVWQDNITDGDGLGISALQLDGSSFSGKNSTFRVNQQGALDQERPRVALLNGGGAVFVWQGGPQSFQHVYARFLSAGNLWLTGDVMVNTPTNVFQINPVVATLAGGNVVVVWASFNEAGSNSMQDVYGQIFSPAGQKIGSEFLINQFTPYNQRTPAVAALNNGGFVVVWVSEQQQSGAVDNPDPNFLYSPTNVPSVDIYARVYGATGSPAGSEFRVNTDASVSANPDVAAASDGSFTVTWGQKDVQVTANSWDIFARPFSSAGAGGTARRVNTQLYGDQFAPRISAVGTDYLVAWTSLGQDGSWEGVYGQFLHGNGSAAGGEFRVNTTWISKQMHPAVASDGVGRFLVVWTSFVGGVGSFDLYAQRYINVAEPLQPMGAPFVYAPFVVSNGVYQPQLQISWPAQAGLPVDHYEVFVDGAVTNAAAITTNIWTMTAANGLTVGSTHSFQVTYVTTDTRRAPLSPSTSGTAWLGYNYYGIPVEWMQQYFGSSWPSPNAPLAPDGPTLLQVFLYGGNPLDSSTWLEVKLVGSPQGLFLTWNPQPGLMYQVQGSTNLSSWTNLGGQRFAPGSQDSIYIGPAKLGYYRVVRLR